MLCLFLEKKHYPLTCQVAGIELLTSKFCLSQIGDDRKLRAGARYILIKIMKNNLSEIGITCTIESYTIRTGTCIR